MEDKPQVVERDKIKSYFTASFNLRYSNSIHQPLSLMHACALSFRLRALEFSSSSADAVLSECCGCVMSLVVSFSFPLIVLGSVFLSVESALIFEWSGTCCPM